MKLHIVMPVINCIDFTKNAIDTIESDCNLILIDNDSNDGTEQYGQMMSSISRITNSHIKEFKYVRNTPAKGVAASWNQGIKIALEDPECKYIAILNNDIILHTKTLTHLMAFMDKSKYVMVTADNIKDRMSVEVMKSMELPNEYTDFDLNEITDWRAEGPDFSCFMINPETVDYIGWFDENFVGAYCEDQDYHVRINRAWRWGKQYGEPPYNRMHAKRLSTAPYYHFASQTLKFNIPLRNDITKRHGQNMSYYLKKWGGEHPFAMDGNGNVTPFGDATKNWKDW